MAGHADAIDMLDPLHRENEGRGRPGDELGFIFQGLGSFFDLAPKLASEATKGGR